MRPLTTLAFALLLIALGCGKASKGNPNVTRENAAKVKTAKTIAEVEAILGPGDTITGSDVPTEYRNATVKGAPLQWKRWEREKGRDRILVGFGSDGSLVTVQEVFYGK
jgi:hypothetical protein